MSSDSRPYVGRHETAPAPLTTPHQAVQAAAMERIRASIPHQARHERGQP
jgi:hypothetical protein